MSVTTSQRLARVFVIGLILQHSAITLADELSAKSDAPGLLERANKLIRENTPDRIGAGNAFVNRDDDRSNIDDVTYDDSTTVMHIKGTLKYKTGPDAAIPAAGEIKYDIQYQLSPPDFRGGTFTIPIKALGNRIGDVAIDVTPIKKALDGDVPALLELIPNGGLVNRDTTSEYDSRKKHFEDTYGKDNIYFASSDFVRWASPETAGKWAGELIVSGGSLAPQIANEARAEMRKEFTHILTWLQKKAGNAAQQAADSLLNGDPISLPNLKLVWQKVEYRSKLIVAGQSLPETPPIPHAAFVLIWQTSNGPPATFTTSPAQKADDSEPRAKWKLGVRYAIGPTGSRVVFLTTGGAAERAGLSIGDIITKCNDLPVGVTDNSSDVIMRQIKKSTTPQLKIEATSGSQTKSMIVTLDPLL